MLKLSPQPVAYRGTVTGLTISAVSGGSTESGGAFVDNLPQAILDLIALYPGKLQFDAYDSAGRFIRGVLVAPGSAEGTTDIISGATLNGNMETGDPPTGWTKKDAADAIDGVADERTGGAGSQSLSVTRITGDGFTYQRVTAAVGRLFKYDYWSKKIEATAGRYPRLGISDVVSTVTGKIQLDGGLTTNLWTDASGYRTNPYTDPYIIPFCFGGAGEHRFDDIIILGVDAPSTSGATIQDGAGLWNWKYKNALFTYNAASYYCVVRLLR